MIDIAKFESIYSEKVDEGKQHESIIDTIQKRQPSDVTFDGADLDSITVLFRNLIYYRCQKSKNCIKWLDENQDEFPKITNDLLNKKEPVYFAVAGMYGGFSYGLFERNGHPVVITDSWSRISDGSGQTHEITPTGVMLVERGYI